MCVARPADRTDLKLCRLTICNVICGVGGEMFRRVTAAFVAAALLNYSGLGMADAQERPTREIMDAVRGCFGKAGIKAPSGPDKSMQLTVEQRKAVDKCLQAAGIQIPDGKP